MHHNRTVNEEKEEKERVRGEGSTFKYLTFGLGRGPSTVCTKIEGSKFLCTRKPPERTACWISREALPPTSNADGSSDMYSSAEDAHRVEELSKERDPRHLQKISSEPTGAL